MTAPSVHRAAAADAFHRLRDWLLRAAAPLWSTAGVDHIVGGFHERMELDGTPSPDPRRARVQGRQIFSMLCAARLGWQGPVEALTGHGFAFIGKAFQRPDGALRTLIDARGAPADDTIVIYDQAFLLLARAAARLAGIEPEIHTAEARRLRDWLVRTYRHPVSGLEEAAPRMLPLKANPHMHLLEAALAWIEAGPAAGDDGWDRLADDIATLALTKMIDPKTGYLHEFFDGDWNFMPGDAGRMVEPGHLYEWAWLLARWGRLRGNTAAITAARRLAEGAEATGLDPARNIAVMGLWDDGSLRDPIARLWPQTERIKAAVALAGIAATPAEADRWLAVATDAAAGLERYFAVPTPGLWRDRMLADGSFVEEPAPASSFYHIVCAIEELGKAVTAG